MKNILFSLGLVISLIIGNTVAFADSPMHTNEDNRGNMNAQEATKSLEKISVITDGKNSWVLHQPNENHQRYFSPTSQGEMTKESSGDTKSQQN